MIEFHYTVDTLLRSGKQLVFSAKISPAEIHGLSSDLVARMASGLVCGVEAPDFGMRLEIAHQYCQYLGIKADSTVINMLVERVYPDARHIQGAINRIGVLQQLTGELLSYEDADRQLADLFNRPQRNVRISDIVFVGVISSGEVLNSINAGQRAFRNFRNTSLNSSVLSTFSPMAPCALASATKSGLLMSVPKTRFGYSRS